MTAPTTEENRDLVRSHFRALNNQDWTACADTLAEEIVFHQAGKTHRGSEWLIEHYKEFYEAFPEASITVDTVLVEGDSVAARITNSGRNAVELPNVDSTDTEIEFSSQFIGQVEDGVLAELWVVAEQPRPRSE